MIDGAAWSQVSPQNQIHASKHPSATFICWLHCDKFMEGCPESAFSTENFVCGARLLNKGNVATRLDAVCLLVETRIGRPFRCESHAPVNAPQPLCAHHLSSWAGLEIIPSVTSPTCSSAINVPQFARPATKPFVPSIPSTIHRRPFRLGIEPISSPRKPSSGRAALSALRTANCVFGVAVS